MTRTKSRPVALSPADRQMLTALVRTGSHPAQQVRRARILLELDENNPDREGPVPFQIVVAERAGVHVDTVVKVSKAYADRGGDVAATITPEEAADPAGGPEGDRRGRGPPDRAGLLAPRPRAWIGGACACWRSTSRSPTTSPTWTTPPSAGS